MAHLSRRRFIQAGAMGTTFGSALWSSPARAEVIKSQDAPAQVQFVMDGLFLSVRDQIQLLSKLASDGKLERDMYLSGGAVEQLETRFAKELGKEKALFLPTGTLANHLALRNLAHGRSRVIVQAESHIYCDSNDCVQQLSHLNLVPLAIGKATIPLAEIEEACKRAVNGPFPVPVGAISIECPVRRKEGEVFDFEEMKRVAAYARKNDIRMHLDGARLFVASAFTGITPEAYSALFDTVYISLYKCFNAGTGAILAGPKAVIDQIAHDRKVFGAGLFQAWHYAAVALHYLDGYLNRLKQATEVAKGLFTLLEQDPRFKVEHAVNGTNIYRLRVKDVEPAKYQQALAKLGVRVGRSGPVFPGVQLVVNESLNGTTAEKLAKGFVEALTHG